MSEKKRPCVCWRRHRQPGPMPAWRTPGLHCHGILMLSPHESMLRMGWRFGGRPATESQKESSMRTLLVVLAAVALGLSLGTAVTHADTVTPTDDTTIVHARTTPPYGLDPVLIISKTAGVVEHRTFVNFDVAALLPPGTPITKALLRV